MFGGHTIEHAGVKGMKWGKRKNPSPGTVSPYARPQVQEFQKKSASTAENMYGRYVDLQNRNRAAQYAKNLNDPKYHRDQRIIQGRATVDDYRSYHVDMAVDKVSKMAVDAGVAYLGKRYGLAVPIKGLGGMGMNLALKVSGEEAKMKKRRQSKEDAKLKLS